MNPISRLPRNVSKATITGNEYWVCRVQVEGKRRTTYLRRDQFTQQEAGEVAEALWLEMKELIVRAWHISSSTTASIIPSTSGVSGRNLLDKPKKAPV